ncbi:MAG: hypothetical protein AAF604_04710 [Acidobacteriota bacterium]
MLANEKVIYAYTRDQAVNDGVLMDAYQGDFEEITQQLFRETPVYIAAGLLSLIERAVANPRWCNDLKGVWWDVAYMSTFGLRRGLPAGETHAYQVIITGTGRRRNHTICVSFDGQALTFCFPEEA